MAHHLFAYGSLIFRPGFSDLAGEPFVAAVIGWERRLDQGSPDHRGSPECLGRVATLTRREGAVTYGLVYPVDPARADAVFEALDLREQGGYERVTLEVAPRDNACAPLDAVTYVAPPTNPFFRGPATFEDMAYDVLRARGPSGTNIDYVTRLARALDALGIDDPHVRGVVEAMMRCAPEMPVAAGASVGLGALRGTA